jgi:hypothetical protein
MITRIFWRLVDISSGMLDSAEREAVRGDLSESGETGSQALREVLGLVIRRQAALWADWRPWLSLVSVVVPLGMLLSIISRSTADLSSVYIWMYADNLDWDLLVSRGFWYEFAHCIPIVFMLYLTLVCWAWTAGFVVAYVSRRVIQANRFLFCLMLLFGVLLAAPKYLEYYGHYVPRALGLPFVPNLNAPVFAQAFYRVILPLIVQAVLVAAPSLWGMRWGAKATRLRPLVRLIACIVAAATLASMVIQEPGFWLFLRAYWRPGIWQGWQMHLLQFVVYWPVMYLVAAAIRRRRYRKAVLA